MLKKIHKHVSSLSRTIKSIIAIVLLIVLGALMFISGTKSNSPTTPGVPVNVDAKLSNAASVYIVSNEYFTRYTGYDLNLESSVKTCDDCYTLTYSFKIDPKFFLNRIHGFTAIIEMKNQSVDTARFVRIA